MIADRVPAERVAAELSDVLSRPEFRSGQPAPSILGRIGRWFAEFLEDLFGLAPGSGGEVFLIAVVGMLAALLVWLVWRIARDRRRGPLADAPAPAQVDPETARRLRVRELRRRAGEAERAGDRLLALRLYFTALVVGLGERGDLEYRDAWTNRELCERGAPRPEIAQLLAPISERLDRQSFGHEPVENDDVRRLARLVDDRLGAFAP